MYWHKDEDLDPEEEAQDIAHDSRRWKLADMNGDGMLDKEEYASFLHPEEADHMKESLIEVAAINGLQQVLQFLSPYST